MVDQAERELVMQHHHLLRSTTNRRVWSFLLHSSSFEAMQAYVAWLDERNDDPPEAEVWVMLQKSFLIGRYALVLWPNENR